MKVNTVSYILLALLVSSLIISLHQVLLRYVQSRSGFNERRPGLILPKHREIHSH